MTVVSRDVRFRRLADRCWTRAQAEDDPILRDLWSRLAAHYQELASEREHYEARLRVSSEPIDAALERRHHAAAGRGKAHLIAESRPRPRR